MKSNGLNRTQLAEKLGVSKGYVSQIMNGDSDHRLSKLVELSLAIGLVPNLNFEELSSVLKEDTLNAIDMPALLKSKEENPNIKE